MCIKEAFVKYPEVFRLRSFTLLPIKSNPIYFHLFESISSVSNPENNKAHSH